MKSSKHKKSKKIKNKKNSKSRIRRERQKVAKIKGKVEKHRQKHKLSVFLSNQIQLIQTIYDKIYVPKVAIMFMPCKI